MGLHRLAQVVADVEHPLAGHRRIEAREARQRVVPRVFRQVAMGQRLPADFRHRAFSAGLAEHDEVQQGVRAEAVRAMDGHACALADREQAGHGHFRIAVLRHDHLPKVVGRDAAHLVVHRRHHRNGILDRIDVGELDGDFANPREAQVDDVRPEVVQLEQQVIGVLAAPAPLLDLGGHRARHDVAAGEVLGVGRVALHETLAVLVQQVSAFTAHAFGDQHACTSDTRGVELPELHVLHRDARAGGHADPVAGVDEGVGAGRINAPASAGGEDRRLALQDHDLAGFHLHGDHAAHRALGIPHEVQRHPLDEELRVDLDVVLVEGVQHCMPRTVRGCAGAHRHLRAAVVLGVAAERALVDLAVLKAVEGHAHVLEFDHDLHGPPAHVFDRVLVAEVVGALDRVVHVPVPVVLGRVRQRCGNAALRSDRMGPGREYLREHRDLHSCTGELQRSAHAGTTCADDDGVKPSYGKRHALISKGSGWTTPGSLRQSAAPASLSTGEGPSA